jgi:hypothetical protein
MKKKKEKKREISEIGERKKAADGQRRVTQFVQHPSRSFIFSKKIEIYKKENK